MCFSFIHLYVFFIHTFVCMFFFIHLYACFSHTFVCDFVYVFLSFICMRVFFHTLVCLFFFIHFYAILYAFLSYICMRVFFIHFYACLYAVFSYICMRFCMCVFVIYLYICILGSRGSMVSVVVQQPEGCRFNPHSLLNKRISGQTAGGVAVYLLVTTEVPLSKASHTPWAL